MGTGSFSEDLDLFYTEQNVKDMFDFKKKVWKELCTLTSDILVATDDSEKCRLESNLNENPLFNYLSEV